ncbi:cytoplasmic dynein 2 intermediate chain 1 [Periplaneta americana]|uniref:cytoplasmic dynein 2 intermediate chain 1 n=1 Tax=Periplaneta americana TaxID=6978 RepID=UPI0037E90445
MPPDRGSVKKSPYDKKTSGSTSTTQRKVVKDDAKDVRLVKGRETKTRESSTSRVSKDKLQKNDVKARTSVRERLAALKSEAEKAKDSSKDVKSDRTKDLRRQDMTKDSSRDVKSDRAKPKETTRVSRQPVPEASRRNTKPTSTPSRTTTRNPAIKEDAAPRRSQLSYRTAHVPERPKINSINSRGDTKATTSTRQVAARKEAERLPNKIRHPDTRRQTQERGRQPEKVDEPKRLGRDRTRTRTLSPREVKVTRSDSEVDRPKQEQRQPVQDVVAVASTSQASGDHQTQPEEDAEDDYEDDFEDYESDFEEDVDTDTSDEGADIRDDGITSDSDDTESESELVELTPRQPVVEEEKKLDSGNYDLAERRRKGRELQEIKMALDRENEALSARERTDAHQSTSQVLPTDEGFEEGKADNPKKFSTVVTHLNFINFANARKRKQEKKATANARKRGEELLDMIQLDSVGFTLFELAPIPYEVYMKSYGRSNTLQAHVQTNEDDLSQEVQTDEIHYKSKWTQKPVSFRTKNEDSEALDEVMIFSQDHLGVGGDSMEENPDSWKERIKVDTVRLNQFLSSAGQVISVLLEEGEILSANKLTRNMMDIPFSDGYISLGVENVPFLAGRPITMLRFPHHHSNLLLTVHKNVEFEDRQTDDITLCRSMTAIWSILEPSSPQKILVAPQEISTCCFDPTRGSLVFAGLVDGAVCVWDLREGLHCHQKVEIEQQEWVLRSPTYNTAEIFKDNGHLGRIVGLQPLVGSEEESEISEKTELSPTQVCSLDESGRIIIWTVIQSHLQSQDLGLAHWGRVRLVLSSTLSASVDPRLRLDLLCFDLQLDSHDHNHLYIATNTGDVVHSLRSGGKPRPLLYVPKWDGYTVVHCIEVCPYGEPYFMIGCGEGTIRLHCQASEKPLAALAGTGDPIGQGPPIISLQWSHSKPFIFFALDSLSRIHVWDLSTSDIHPLYTVPFGTITAIQLSPDVGDARNPPQMALATGPGRVEIHQLRQEYFSQGPGETDSDLKNFLHYTSIL